MPHMRHCQAAANLRREALRKPSRFHDEVLRLRLERRTADNHQMIFQRHPRHEERHARANSEKGRARYFLRPLMLLVVCASVATLRNQSLASPDPVTRSLSDASLPEASVVLGESRKPCKHGLGALQKSRRNGAATSSVIKRRTDLRRQWLFKRTT